MRAPFTLLFLLLLTAGLLAEDPAHTYASRFERRYNSAQTLQATFLEEYSESGKTVRKESGTVSFRRPGKMRWDYEAPEKNLFLVDGKTTWFYVPADRTVMKVPAADSNDWRTPVALLAGQWKVSRACARLSLAPQPVDSPANIELSCVLKGDPGAKSPAAAADTTILFELVRDTGELVHLTIADAPGGIRTEFYFRNWVYNPPLPDTLFHFNAPPNVAIVDARNSPFLPQH